MLTRMNADVGRWPSAGFARAVRDVATKGVTTAVLEAMHYFSIHNITLRALPRDFGNGNSVWKRFSRLSKSCVFKAFFDALAAMSQTPHFVQMFDSTVVRARVSVAGAKGHKTIRPSSVRAASRIASEIRSNLK